MTALTFSIDARRYGIDVVDVEAVLPVPPLRSLDHTPAWVAGVFQFRGELVPVLDVSQMHTGRPSCASYATRVIVMRYPIDGGGSHWLGLMAEDVTDIVDIEEASLEAPGVSTPEAPWLGPIGSSGAGALIQVVRLEQVLPPDVRSLLFQDAREPRP